MYLDSKIETQWTQVTHSELCHDLSLEIIYHIGAAPNHYQAINIDSY
jgi:hypothetical protein